MRVALSPSRISEHYILVRTTVTTPRRARASERGAGGGRRLHGVSRRVRSDANSPPHTHTRRCNDSAQMQRQMRADGEGNVTERDYREGLCLYLSRFSCQNHMFAGRCLRRFGREERASRNRERYHLSRCTATAIYVPPLYRHQHKHHPRTKVYRTDDERRCTCPDSCHPTDAARDDSTAIPRPRRSPLSSAPLPRRAITPTVLARFGERTASNRPFRRPRETRVARAICRDSTATSRSIKRKPVRWKWGFLKLGGFWKMAAGWQITYVLFFLI